MMALRRTLPALAMLAVMAAALLPAAAVAENLDLAAAINKAGRQRMLSQRILLTYCQEGLLVNGGKAETRRHEAIALFDAQLAELDAFAPNARVREAIAAVERIWAPFKDVAHAPAHREGAKKLLFSNDDLLFASNKVVQLLQDMAGDRYARLVNMAGRQRMLSQRIAKFYMLIEWGFDTLTIYDELERARNEFAGALTRLQAEPANTAAIDRELEEVELHWTWFNNAIELQGADVYRLVVSDSSEAILEGMDRVTALYEELSDR